MHHPRINVAAKPKAVGIGKRCSGETTPPPPGQVGDGHLPTEMRALCILNRGPVYSRPSYVERPHTPTR
jgi:hypothetical protein